MTLKSYVDTLVPPYLAASQSEAWSSLPPAPVPQGTLFSGVLLPLGPRNWLPPPAPGAGAKSSQRHHPWLFPLLLPTALLGALHYPSSVPAL